MTNKFVKCAAFWAQGHVLLYFCVFFVVVIVFRVRSDEF